MRGATAKLYKKSKIILIPINLCKDLQ